MSERLINKLLEVLPNAKLASNNRFIVCRCVHCGDSKSDPNKTSMYITLPNDNTQLMYYDCFRASCDAKGIVDENKLIEWGINDSDILVDITKQNQKAFKLDKDKKIRVKDRTLYQVHNDYTINDKTKRKLKYLNARLGTNLSFEDAKKLNIILSLKDVIRASKINNLTRSEMVCKEIDENYIGFLSSDRGMGIFRSIKKNAKYRYMKYTFINNTSPEDYYVIPTTIDTFKKCTVFIAEGPFDILSIYHNLNKKEIPNSLFISCSGAKYMQAVKWVMNRLKIINLEFHLYLDSDIRNSIIRDIKRIYDIVGYDFYIHRNAFEGEKDFGVPKDRIKDSCSNVIR